jgi:MYXO-CTERM domain-containing protein
VWARDALGNTGSEALDVETLGFHGDDVGGCDCSAGGSPGSIAGMLVVFGLALLFLARRRLRPPVGSARAIVAVAVTILGAGMVGGCSCGSEAGPPICEDDQVLICFDDEMTMCTCTDQIRLGRVGQHSEMAVGPDGSYWVSAYNASYGDLMVANVFDQGRVPDEAWQFLDGIPEGPVAVPGSDIRGGIREPGPDVGLYTSIATAETGEVVISYFAKETGSLKVATFAGDTWATHDVDIGSLGDDVQGFEIAGQYSSIVIGNDGLATVAYFVNVSDDEGHRTEVRLARASAAAPSSAADWSIAVVEATPVEVTGEPDPLNIPEGSGLFIDVDLDSAGEPVLAYYDRTGGALRVAASDGAGGFAVTTLDGGDGARDVGWYPGLAVDSQDRVHVSYVSASNDDLLYINTLDGSPELVDDGYRIVGQTEDGLPEPEFHFVGDDSELVLTSAGAVIIYQDATTHELLLARKDETGRWIRETIVGDEDPFAGAYGFYASARLHGPDGDAVVMSSWVIDQPNNDAWVEILSRQIVVE